MPKKPMTQNEIDIEREKILEATLTIITSEGFEAISMRKIANQLDMSATKIYSYFKNKDEVYLAIVIKGYRILFEETSKASKLGTDPIDRLRKFILAYIDFAMNKTHFYELMFSSHAPKYSSYIGKPLEETALSKKNIGLMFFNGLLDCVKNCNFDDSQLSHSEIKQSTILLLGQVHGIINLYHNKLLQEVTEDPEQIINSTVEHIINSLRKNKKTFVE